MCVHETTVLSSRFNVSSQEQLGRLQLQKGIFGHVRAGKGLGVLTSGRASDSRSYEEGGSKLSCAKHTTPEALPA